jgi:methionyl-tRNA formyltransferase
VSAWRVVLISQIGDAVAGLSALLAALGHEVVGVLATRDTRLAERLGAVVAATPAGADFLSPGSRARIAPLLASCEPDITICVGFPWKIPADALAVPRLAALNLHPSPLPRYRGPSPIAWALVNNEPELAMTVHRMDSELDTGAILGQAAVPLEPGLTVEGVVDKLRGLTAELLPQALERVARGEEGDPQSEVDASYFSFLGEQQRTIDWSRPAAEIHNLVLAWQFDSGGGGAVGELEGEPRRIVETRLDPDDGAVRVECGDAPIWVVQSDPV